MSERIHVVLPDGVKDNLISEAQKQRRNASNLAMKYIIDGLSRDNKAVVSDKKQQIPPVDFKD